MTDMFNKFTLAILLSCFFFGNLAISQEVSIGGFSERFGEDADGDNTPPDCTINVPSFAASEFQVLWLCEDNKEPQDNIRTELWIRKNGDQVDQLVQQFLGFPAGLDISRETLGISSTADFESGLPAGFRLVARDRAGNATISELLVVSPGVAPVSECDISVVVDGESTEGVVATTTTAALSNTSVSVISNLVTGTGTAAPCEIESICSDDSSVSFTINFSAADSGTVDSASIDIDTGTISSDLTGNVTLDGTTVTALSLTGETTVEDSDTTVTVNCEQ